MRTDTELNKEWKEYVDSGVFDKQLEKYDDEAFIHAPVTEEDAEDAGELGDARIPVVHVDIDLKELADKNMRLFADFMEYPNESIDIITGNLKEYGKKSRDAFVTVSNFSWVPNGDRIKIRQIRSDKVGKVVVFSALVRIASVVQSRLRIAVCKCESCLQSDIELMQTGLETDFSVTACPACDEPHPRLSMIEARSVFTNFMRCECEEEPENSHGRQPERIECEIVGPLTDENIRIGIGDRVDVFGIYSVKRKDKKTTVYDRYVKIIGIDKKGKNYEDLVVTPEEEKLFKDYANDEHLLQEFASRIAPHIHGHNREKEAMVLQLFGGNQYCERRGNIHLLLVGERSVGKSNMMNNMERISHHSVKATGGNTTQVGLTACVSQDEMTGHHYLEAGAAVLADGGLLIIDEFDKMDEKIRAGIHEVLEDQRVTVTKANINAVMPARCSVLAVMNPKGGKFIDGGSVIDQINLPDTLLSRFDLVFALKDRVNENEDRKTAKSVLSARQTARQEETGEMSDMTKYVLYARTKVKEMTFSEEMENLITEKYIAIRKENNVDDNVSISARQLEGACRLAEASAKMRLSSIVEKQDAEVAISLIEYYLETMCLDPATGKHYVEMAQGGHNPTEVNRTDKLTSLIDYEDRELRGKFPTNPAKWWVEVEDIKSSFLLDDSKPTEKDFNNLMKVLCNKRKFIYNGDATMIQVSKTPGM